MSPWPDRLRHSAIVLLAAAVSLAVIVVMGDLSALRGLAVFACIAAAALVPWRLHNPAASREDVPSIRPPILAAKLSPVPRRYVG
jgi:two-component system phosphate regulon sensor histidine kinase PhoR